MLKSLNEKNKDLKIFSVDDEEFATFGRVVRNIDVSSLVDEAKKIVNPESGSSYMASTEAFEALPVAKEIQDYFYGTMPTEIGYCWGHSNFLNATEWHSSNEVNIAVTPLVLLLGHVWDIKDGGIHADQFTAFYVPEGTVIEVYSSTLHFCPCEVNENGFGCIVALPKGTNTDLMAPTADPMLFRKNKWIIAHEENDGLQKRGVIPGISGTNYEIKY